MTTPKIEPISGLATAHESMTNWSQHFEVRKRGGLYFHVHNGIWSGVLHKGTMYSPDGEVMAKDVKVAWEGFVPFHKDEYGLTEIDLDWVHGYVKRQIAKA